MKTFNTLTTFLIIPMVVLLMSSKQGSVGGKTGSPADVNTCAQCHGGTANTVSGWITSDIPSQGYVPGNTYTITLSATQTGISRFGFELTAEDTQNSKAGTFSLTTPTETQLTNSNAAVTHTVNGIDALVNALTWTMNWTAPAAGSGDIGFYAAVNAADGDEGTSGDVIYKTSISVSEDLTTGISELSQDELNIYPNPSNGNFTIETEKGNELAIISPAGRMVYYNRDSESSNQVDLGELSKGIYFLKINNQAGVAKKIVIQ